MKEEVRVRFAPSPTGPLHIGGARSALFNYLFARNNNGSFILRIEDTDRERSREEFEENIKESIRWLGIDWDEGIDKGGDYGPYRQMERLHVYKEYAYRLLEEGLAYRCYCTEDELERERKEYLEKSEMPRYSGRCFNITPEEEEKLKQEGRSPALRFKVPKDRSVTVNDLVRGSIKFETNGISDFIIMKASGIPTYNFAVVLDDHEMKISHVIRGEEHLTNTGPQALLYEALKLEMPSFAHVSLILGKDRTKMSKRHGQTSVLQYKEDGFLPEAMTNFLVLLGWAPEGEEEIFTLEELVKIFSLSRASRSPAIFDIEKLRWINGYYIRNSSDERIARLSIPYLQEAGYLKGEPSVEEVKWLEKVASVVKSYLSTVGEISENFDIFVNNRFEFESQEAEKELFGDHVLVVLDKLIEKLSHLSELDEESVKKAIKGIPEELELKPKKAFMPLRVALTGKKSGPELHQLISVLGIENVKERIYYIKEKYFKE